MFSHVATAGAKVFVNCSWNDDTSATTTSTGCSTASTNGRPMLPAATARFPDSTSIAATNVVTVVLPLVPVMATIGIVARRAASSISLTSSTPAESAMAYTGCDTGTP